MSRVTSGSAYARAPREQIDWPQLRIRVAASPYAKAFMTLVEELGVAPSRPGATAGPRRVRVVSSEV